MGQGDADGDRVPRRGVGSDPGDFARERDTALQEAAQVAIAEAWDVAEL